jgi:hypothetical protein
MSPISEELVQHMEDILLSDLAIDQARIINVAHPNSPHQDLVVALSLSDLIADDSDAAMRHVRGQLIASIASLGAGGSLVPRKWAKLASLPSDPYTGEVDDDALRSVLQNLLKNTTVIKSKNDKAAVDSSAERSSSSRSKAAAAATAASIARGFCLSQLGHDLDVVSLSERRGSAVPAIGVAV